MTSRPIIGHHLGWSGWYVWFTLESHQRVKPKHRYSFFWIFLSLARLIFRNKPKILSPLERWPFLFYKSTKMASFRGFCDDIIIANDLLSHTNSRICGVAFARESNVTQSNISLELNLSHNGQNLWRCSCSYFIFLVLRPPCLSPGQGETERHITGRTAIQLILRLKSVSQRHEESHRRTKIWFPVLRFFDLRIRTDCSEHVNSFIDAYWAYVRKRT